MRSWKRGRCVRVTLVRVGVAVERGTEVEQVKGGVDGIWPWTLNESVET